MKKVEIKKIKAGDTINTSLIGLVFVTKVTKKYIYLKLYFVPGGSVGRRWNKVTNKFEYRLCLLKKWTVDTRNIELLDLYTPAASKGNHP